MQRHVANLCCICKYHLQELQRVRRYLNYETAVKVANALVSNHLDYCNSLLYHIKKAYTVRLQRVQNALCHTVCKLNKFSYATPFLHKLHRLPIHYRILFKYNLLTYKATNFSRHRSHTRQSPIDCLIQTEYTLTLAAEISSLKPLEPCKISPDLENS